VPYSVLLLQDEFGNAWAQKSDDAQPIGVALEMKSSAAPDAVAIIKTKFSAKESITQALALIGGIQYDRDAKI